MTKRFNIFFNKKPRPDWAGSITVEMESTTTRYSHDTPVIEYRQVERPTAISGIILPTSTKGRDPAPPIYGHNTAYSGLHKGHLMALSLGAPDTSDVVVPQGGPANTNPNYNNGGINVTPQEMSWRALEIFLEYASDYVMRTDDYSCDSIARGFCLDKCLGTNIERLFTGRYDIACNYSNRQRQISQYSMCKKWNYPINSHETDDYFRMPCPKYGLEYVCTPLYRHKRTIMPYEVNVDIYWVLNLRTPASSPKKLLLNKNFDWDEGINHATDLNTDRGEEKQVAEEYLRKEGMGIRNKKKPRKRTPTNHFNPSNWN